ncbi:predicted protein [Histoplasma mississippiense (nom. inval.)]|uniref:predicted protein n=1 Tax=Ajellomyces capsulatus (strain NAm1 / WU24) TaxID=2059318 RepID=UPI000157D308|nr:predicted protein [Histoplasma mississippiense (nom. inval.)]EDN04473.1 predicted protein [Histoplasma mississippiense (nom. inval.)]
MTRVIEAPIAKTGLQILRTRLSQFPINLLSKQKDKVRKDRKNNAVREHYSRCYHDQRAYHHEKQAARKHAGRGWYHGFKRRMGVHQNKVV